LKKSILHFVLSFVFAGTLFALTILSHGVIYATNKAEVLKILSDGFALPALLLLSGSALVWLKGKGAFFGLSTLSKSFLKGIFPASFKDRSEQRICKWSAHTPAPSALVGTIFFALSLLTALPLI
jgi:hypothetical protein